MTHSPPVDPTPEQRWFYAIGLPGVSPPFSQEIRKDDLETLMGWATQNRILGHLAGLLEEPPAQIDDDARALIHERVAGQARWQLRLEAELVRVGSALDEAGIHFVVLKGLAAAHVLYPVPSMRQTADVDLLIPVGSLRAATDSAMTRGVNRLSVGLTSDFEERFGKSTTLRTPTGVELDIHQRILSGPYGRAVDHHGLFESSTSYRLANKQFGSLGLEDMVIHAAAHRVLVDGHLSSVRDIHQALWTSDLQPAALIGRCRHHRCLEVVRTALEEARRWYPVPEAFTEALAEEPADPWEETQMRGIRSEERSRLIMLRTVRALPSLRERVAFARAVAFPSSDFLAASGRGSRSQHWRSALSALPRTIRRGRR